MSRWNFVHASASACLSARGALSWMMSWYHVARHLLAHLLQRGRGSGVPPEEAARRPEPVRRDVQGNLEDGPKGMCRHVCSVVLSAIPRLSVEL